MSNTTETAIEARHMPGEKLTPLQRELCDLAARLILEGGHPEDLQGFLNALASHQWRMYIGSDEEREKPGDRDFPSRWIEELKQTRLPKIEAPEAATTVEEMVRDGVRSELARLFSDFLNIRAYYEDLWLMREVLRNCEGDPSRGLAANFLAEIDQHSEYIKVPYHVAEYARAMVELCVNHLGDKAA